MIEVERNQPSPPPPAKRVRVGTKNQTTGRFRGVELFPFCTVIIGQYFRELTKEELRIPGKRSGDTVGDFAIHVDEVDELCQALQEMKTQLTT